MLTMIPHGGQNNLDFVQQTLSNKKIADALVALGADKNTVEMDMKDVSGLSTSLKLLAPTVATFQAAKSEQMNIKSLKNKYKAVDWVKFINTFIINSSIPITDNTMMIFKGDFFQKTYALLQSTKPRVIANFVTLDVLAGALPAILPNGTKWGHGVEKVLIYFMKLHTFIFQHTVASLYVKKEFNKDKRQQAQNIVDTGINEMKLLLSEIKWMDNATKQKAIKKADAMLSVVGYNDEILDSNKINTFIDQFLEKFDSSSLVNNQVFIVQSFTKCGALIS